MHVLVLEPYCGGSHEAFLDRWSDHSRHTFDRLTLAAHGWKWRMRHAAVTFAERLRERASKRGACDAVFCSDMLDLATFRGLAPAWLQDVPVVVYFHENQLTYPVRHEDERDLHFAVTNLTTALAADEVWFNSAFHRDSFLDAWRELARRLPDRSFIGFAERIGAKSRVEAPPVADIRKPLPRAGGPMRIAWAARWEHDKNPEDFFEALRELVDRGVDFRLSVLGEQFGDAPAAFAEGRGEFAGRIDQFGFLPSRRDYLEALARSDVFVSTARHEFFGISAVEAAAVGALPLLPKRLAYPEVFAANGDGSIFFYDGSPSHLAHRLMALGGRLIGGDDLDAERDLATRIASAYEPAKRAATMDDALERLVGGSR